MREVRTINQLSQDRLQANLKVGGDKYWCQSLGPGPPPRPVHQQVAVALYIPGAGPGSTAERTRIKLNIGYGTVSLYVSRTVNLLASMASKYIQWPSKEVRHQQRVSRIDEDFGNCIGYLDGSEIALRDKPKHDHEAYFSRKKVYGFHLQVNLSLKFHFESSASG